MHLAAILSAILLAYSCAASLLPVNANNQSAITAAISDDEVATLALLETVDTIKAVVDEDHNGSGEFSSASSVSDVSTSLEISTSFHVTSSVQSPQKLMQSH